MPRASLTVICAAAGLAAASLTATIVFAAPAAASAPAVTHYTLDPARSSLEFTFKQAGALNKGHFGRFPVSLDFAADNLSAGRLEVGVDVTSLDTGDKDRDDTLRSADLLSVAKFPQARFSAAQIVKTADGYEAAGTLTIRGVTRDVRVPFTFRNASEQGTTVGYMSGKVTIRRLDFGVGQGDWKATDQVANDVVVSFALRLTGH
jgi:polyisoprenoid-binding protein YceI